MLRSDKIYIAGHKGLVGRALHRQLSAQGYENLLVRTHRELDLTRQADVEEMFHREQPDVVFLAAAKVGGILANSTQPARFIYDNLAMETNILHAAWKNGVKRLLFLGSSCIYPRDCPQPIKEQYLLTGPLEATNEPYAIAKIAGIKMCQAYNRQYGTHFFSVMPTNLYGPNDNFDLKTSHVLPALLRKCHEAKQLDRADPDAGRLSVWGSGKPRREFLHVDDLADACIFLMGLEFETLSNLAGDGEPPLINVGHGKEITIEDLARLIMDVVGFDGKIQFDPSRPDGTPQKRLDISKLTRLGWTPKISLTEGIRTTYQWCLENKIL